VPATDVAYMMAMHWYPERRVRLEAPLLKRYHAGLRAHGITDYSLERLWETIGAPSSVTWRSRLGSIRSGSLPRSGGHIFTASSRRLRIWTAPRFFDLSRSRRSTQTARDSRHGAQQDAHAPIRQRE
jgi:hypothetical protein